MDLEAHRRLVEELRSDKYKPVLDGPVDENLYARANPRIVWILREPNGGGGWDLRKFLASDEELFKYPKWWATFGLVSIISHGLLHNLQWGDWASNLKVLTPALRRIAVLNVNKRGGAAQVDWNRICRESSEQEDVLVRQIKYLSPQVIILGGTYDLLPYQIREVVDGLQDPTMKMKAIRANDSVWFRGYHPNQSRISRQVYYQKLRDELVRLYGSRDTMPDPDTSFFDFSSRPQPKSHERRTR